MERVIRIGGLEEYKRWVSENLSAFPDMKVAGPQRILGGAK